VLEDVDVVIVTVKPADAVSPATFVVTITL